MAFALSILLFTVLAVVGQVVLTSLHRQDNALQSMLLAPAIGLSTLVLPIFWLSSLGIPIAQFGVGLAVVMAIAIAFSLWNFRFKLPWREYLPFLAIIFAALLMTGRPLLEFGFDWMSFSNLDMTGLYSPATQRFLEHGYYASQDASFLSGKDYAQSVRGVYVDSGLRSGSELLLAWLLSLTGLTPHQAYMPFGLATYMSLISAMGGMVYQTSALRVPALLSSILLSGSALTTLPVLNQLTPQIAGTAVLIGSSTLVMQPFSNLGKKALLKQGVLVGILLSGLLLIYVEFVPFVILGFFVYALVNFTKKRLVVKPLLPIAIAALLILLTLNRYLLGRFSHFLLVLPQGSSRALIPLFPYYLIPSGLGELWGFKNMSGSTPDVEVSISIVTGGLLLLFVFIGSISLIRTGYPAPILSTLMLGVAIALFASQSAFGLFKLAMIIQPFLLGTLVIFWCSLFRRRSLQILPLILIGLLGLPTQFNYVEASRNLMKTSGFSEIPYASGSHINTEFKQIVLTANAENLVVDTSNISLAWAQALYTKGKITAFPVFNNFVNSEFTKSSLDNSLAVHSFDLIASSASTAKNEFLTAKVRREPSAGSSNSVLITPTHRQGIFNRRRFDPASLKNFLSQPWNQVKNHLVFAPSKLGPHYFPSTNIASFYQLEPDLFYPGRTMVALGRYMLLRVINPSDAVRLALDITSSLRADGENKLPQATAIGTEREIFPLKGRGAARIFSPVLVPQVIDGLAYLAIDMGEDAVAFPQVRKGLMSLYGKDISVGRKQLVAFGRDVSLISEAEYASLNAPNHLKLFPTDLTNPELEYSGIYEDGWTSEAAFVKLSQPISSKLTLQGMVPMISNSAFTTNLQVSVDGKKVSSQILKLGEFKLKIAVPFEKRLRRIDLEFSDFQRLPASDNRPVAAQLKFIGFADENY